MRDDLFDISFNSVQKDALWIIDNAAPDKATSQVALTWHSILKTVRTASWEQCKEADMEVHSCSGCAQCYEESCVQQKPGQDVEQSLLKSATSPQPASSRRPS